MTIEDINKYIASNEAPPHSKRFELRSLINKHPYFQAGMFIYLKNLYLDKKTDLFRSELQRLSIFISDKRALFYYVLSDEYSKFFKQKGSQKGINKNRTDILLNAFFETMDDSAIDNKIEKGAVHPQMVYSDYFRYAKSEPENIEIQIESSKPMKHQNIIDDFINSSDGNENIKFSPGDKDSYKGVKDKEKSEEELSEELQDDLFFTETLANIYIKQQKYERAYEIIKRLSLNYPEKNIYFAIQISFLEKLIINKKHKK